MGRRSAIVIGLAAAGVMALGAQTAAATDVVTYDSKVTIGSERSFHYGSVESELSECKLGRLVTLFRPRPEGPDRKLATTRTHLENVGGIGGEPGAWKSYRDLLWWGPVYAKVSRVVGDGFVCRANRSKTYQYYYDAKVTIHRGESHPFFIDGTVTSRVSLCELGRLVILFRPRPGPDRKLATTRTQRRRKVEGRWKLRPASWVRRSGSTVYAKVTRKVGDGFVCRAHRSKNIVA